MEHPTYEQLVSLIEGTHADASTKTVKEHVENCPRCAAEIAGWRRTIRRLERYSWPKPQEMRPALVATTLKWAAAAVFVMGIGFGFGRLSKPSAEHLRQGIALQVKQQVAKELREDLLAAFARSGSGSPDAFRQQLHREIAAAMNFSSPTPETQRLVKTVQAVQRKQDEGQRMMFALLNQVRQEHLADYLSLRHDLETAASVADGDLQRSQQQLNQLAATLLVKSPE